jgi:hypothetical protein
MSQSIPEPGTSRNLLLPSDTSLLLLALVLAYRNEFQASRRHFGTARFRKIFLFYININSLSDMLQIFDSNYVAGSIPDEVIGFSN